MCRLEKKLEDAGFVDVQIGQPADTFGGAGGEKKARLFEVLAIPSSRGSRNRSKDPNFRRPNGRRTVFWIDFRKALSAEFVRFEAHELRVSKTPAFLPLRLESGFRGNDANGHSRQFGSLPFGSIRTAELLGAFGIFDVR